MQVSVFNLMPEGSLYGADIHYITEIGTVPKLTSVPGIDAEGVYNFRGQVIPVYDLGKLLGVETEPGRIMVIEVQDSLVGVLVHNITEVKTLEEDSMQESPVEQEYIVGIANLGEDMVVVIDLPTLLT